MVWEHFTWTVLSTPVFPWVQCLIIAIVVLVAEIYIVLMDENTEVQRCHLISPGHPGSKWQSCESRPRSLAPASPFLHHCALNKWIYIFQLIDYFYSGFRFIEKNWADNPESLRDEANQQMKCPLMERDHGSLLIQGAWEENASIAISMCPARYIGYAIRFS